MPSRKAVWARSTELEREALLLGALKKGSTAQKLADAFESGIHGTEARLVALRAAGKVRCTNKVWYRTDALDFHRVKEPRERAISPKELKFLARQVGIGFGERRG